MPRYRMDSFFPVIGEPGGFRKQTNGIDASGDDEAVREAQRVAAEQKPHHFLLLAVGAVADRIIHASTEG